MGYGFSVSGNIGMALGYRNVEFIEGTNTLFDSSADPSLVFGLKIGWGIDSKKE
jgi:hypothetical protein